MIFLLPRHGAAYGVCVQKLRDKNFHRDETTRQRFLQAMKETVQQLKNHPSILYWTIFEV